MFALLIYGSGSVSAMILMWALQGQHGPFVYIIMSPHLRGVGHIEFDADPIGVGIGISIGATLSCLHNILWTSVWILKFSWIYNREITKNWLDFGDIDLIFKVTAVENWKFAVGGHLLYLKIYIVVWIQHLGFTVFELMILTAEYMLFLVYSVTLGNSVFIISTDSVGCLAHFSQEFPKKVIGKQSRPRSDATECNIWSGLHCLH